MLCISFYHRIPWNQIVRMHFVKHLMCILNTTKLGIHTNKLSSQTNIRLEPNFYHVTMDAFSFFQFSRLDENLQNPAISNGVFYKASLVEKIQNVQCLLPSPWNFWCHGVFKGFSLNNNDDGFWILIFLVATGIDGFEVVSVNGIVWR